MPSGSALTMLTATANGDRAVFAHGPTRRRDRHGDFAPIAGARYDIATTVATPRAATCWSPIPATSRACCSRSIATSRRTSPVGALAVDDQLVVTTQNVGTEASITVFDHDGRR